MPTGNIPKKYRYLLGRMAAKTRYNTGLPVAMQEMERGDMALLVCKGSDQDRLVVLILCMHCFFHRQPPDFSSGGCLEHAHNRIAYGCPGRISIHMSRTEHDMLRYLRKLTCGESIYEIHIDGGVQKTQAYIAVFDRSVSILAENNSTAGIFL